MPKVVEAMNDGAFGFIEADHATPSLAVLDKPPRSCPGRREPALAGRAARNDASLDDMAARKRKMKQLFTLLRKVAPSDASGPPG